MGTNLQDSAYKLVQISKWNIILYEVPVDDSLVPGHFTSDMGQAQGTFNIRKKRYPDCMFLSCHIWVSE